MDWSEEALDASLLPAFTQRGVVDRTPGTDQQPVWRRLTTRDAHLPTGLTQGRKETEIFRKSSPSPTNRLLETASKPLSRSQTDSVYDQNDEHEELTEHYEQSFILHDEISSSQILESDHSNDVSYCVRTQEFSFMSSASSDYDPEAAEIHTKLHSIHISNLADLPDASHLSRINPQTMTVNLVVGIISISPVGSITTRRSGRRVDLVEVTVGDETRSGFGITIWLPTQAAKATKETRPHGEEIDHLRDQILGLWPQDLVLARGIALTSFRGIVHGQSLRRGMTTLDLLCRNPVDADDKRGPYATWMQEMVEGETSDQLRKIGRTRTWVMRFVAGPGGRPSRARGENSLQDEHLKTLPLDTP